MLKPFAAVISLLAFTLFLAAQQPAAAPPDSSCPVCDPPITGDALAALQAGNLRYAGNEQYGPAPKHLHQSVLCGLRLARSQKPFPVILSYSDSRVPPALAFDLVVAAYFALP